MSRDHSFLIGRDSRRSYKMPRNVYFVRCCFCFDCTAGLLLLDGALYCCFGGLDERDCCGAFAWLYCFDGLLFGARFTDGVLARGLL